MINTIRTFISQAQKRIHPTSMDKLIIYSESEYVPLKISKALEDLKASAFVDEIEIFDVLDNLKLTEKNIQTKVLITIPLNFLLESIFS